MSVNLRNRLDMRGTIPMDAAEENRCATEYVKSRDPLWAERLVKANLEATSGGPSRFSPWRHLARPGRLAFDPSFDNRRPLCSEEIS